MKFPAPKWLDKAEADVIRKIMIAAEDRGYRVSVIDSIEGDGEGVVNRSADYFKVWSELFHTKSAILVFWDGDQRLGYVALIFNNSEGDLEQVICDCYDWPEILELISEATECFF
jgi:hypothetical protein